VSPVDYRRRAPASAQYEYFPMCRGRLVDDVDVIADRLRPTCEQCGWIYYPAGPMGASVVVELDGQVLVIAPPDAAEGGSAMPGGMVEYGETPEQAAMRETLEETGLVVDRLEELVRFQVDGPFGPMLHFGFRGRAIGGELREGDEGPARWIRRGDLARVIASDREGSRRTVEAYGRRRGVHD